MRYKIWNKEDDIVMSNCVIYTAEKWIQMHPMAQREDVKVVCGGGIVTGKYFFIFDDFVQEYEEMGVDFSECETDQDYLDTIEAYQTGFRFDDMTRLADALEDLVVLNMPDEEE